MKKRSVFSPLAIAAAVGVIALSGRIAVAQDYPTRPVRIVVPFSVSTAVDVAARLLSQKLSDSLKQNVFVENLVGANAIVGTTRVSIAAPDGYTLLFTAPPHYINQSLYAKLSYDPVKGFRPISKVAALPLVLVVPSSLPVKSVKDLIALARSRPGALNYSSAGSGSTTHLTAALFCTMANVNIVHVPYKSGAQAVIDTISGQIALTFTAVATALPQIEAGKLRALGITSAKRLASLPQLPTIAEAGVPGYEFVSWNKMFAPAGTSDDIVRRLHAEVERAARSKDFVDQLTIQGMYLDLLGPDELTAEIPAEIKKWAQIVKISGAKAE